MGERMNGDDQDKRSTLLTSKEIAALNRAREVLKRLEDTAWRRSLEYYDPFGDVTAWDLGRLSGAASAAEDALFHVLSTARANCGVKMTDAQLRGAAPSPPVGSGPRADVRDSGQASAAGPRGPIRAV
jgi:hypothetical protein